MLARRRAHLEHARLRRLAGEGAAAPAPDLDSVRERVADLLRPGAVARHLREALDLYLDEASREADAEIESRRRRADEPPAGFEAAIAEATLPADRARVLRAWESLERALEPARAARAGQRSDAARAAGGRDVADLRERSLGVPLRELLAEAERRAIAPLDEAVARAARAVPAAPEVSAIGAPVLRHLGAGIGEDPDVRGARLLPGGPSCWRSSAVCPPGERAVAVIGSRQGIGGGLDALEAFGTAIRAAVVARERGASAQAAEHPSWSRAAGALFRRLALDGRFRSFAGWPELEPLEDALRLDAAVRPRIAWASAIAALDADPAQQATGLFRRAAAADPFPSVRAAAWDRDPSEAASWLGEVWAVLLEERLRTRWGRAWFGNAAAGSWLRDVWVAEPASEPGAMASQAGVGTMTPDAILEACRPPTRVC